MAGRQEQLDPTPIQRPPQDAGSILDSDEEKRRMAREEIEAEASNEQGPLATESLMDRLDSLISSNPEEFVINFIQTVGQ